MPFQSINYQSILLIPNFNGFVKTTTHNLCHIFSITYTINIISMTYECFYILPTLSLPYFYSFIKTATSYFLSIIRKTYRCNRICMSL